MANVATASPPMTARPSGAFCSPPSPSPSDIGSMRMIMASAVISTGRRRVAPAASAAARASAVATPTLMIAPMRAGTLGVVPQNAPGKAMMMMNGSSDAAGVLA